MTDPDQLPAFHVPLSPTMEKAVWLSDALTAIATERARADALRAELGESDAVRERLAELLKQTAVALRGEPPPLTSWSWHDVPERAAAAIAAIDVMQRAASINAERADALEAALREVLLAQENYARCHAREVNAINNYSGGQAEYSSATLKATVRVSEAERAARALLEKKT